MTMIPWENGIIVPPADIGLPVWLSDTAALIGFTFPDISERALLILGREYAALARNLEQSRASTDGVTSNLTVLNHGPAMTAFTLYRERLSGPNGSHMIVSVTAAGVMSTAYCGAAAVVMGMKAKAILALMDALLATGTVKAFAATSPKAAAWVGALTLVVEQALTVLTGIVAVAKQDITTLFAVAGRVIELYTSVATPVLQDRPSDADRGDIPYVAVPGGLASHEGAPPNGGHALLKHVNVDDRYIIDRVANTPASEASRWIDLPTAERVTAQVIGLNKATIAAWLASNGRPTLALHLGTGVSVTGRYIDMSSPTPRDVTGARIVLKKDPSRPDGYFILSAFPEP